MFKRRLKKIILGTLFLALLAAGIVWVSWQILPDASRLKTEFPLIRYKGPKAPFEVQWTKKKPVQWVGISEISKQATGAILVSEDWAFYQHPGVDVKQLREAVEDSWREGHFTRGASTITQQVAKNVFLSNERSLVRKLRELVLALELEKTVGKRRILETYLNIAEWGEGIYGIQAASQYYFSKKPSELSPVDGAFLAMLLPNPRHYSVSYRQKKLTPYARETVDSILEKMRQAHYLTDEEAATLTAKPLSFEVDQPSQVESQSTGWPGAENSSNMQH